MSAMARRCSSSLRATGGAVVGGSVVDRAGDREGRMRKGQTNFESRAWSVPGRRQLVVGTLLRRQYSTALPSIYTFWKRPITRGNSRGPEWRVLPPSTTRLRGITEAYCEGAPPAHHLSALFLLACLSVAARTRPDVCSGRSEPNSHQILAYACAAAASRSDRIFSLFNCCQRWYLFGPNIKEAARGDAAYTPRK